MKRINKKLIILTSAVLLVSTLLIYFFVLSKEDKTEDNQNRITTNAKSPNSTTQDTSQLNIKYDINVGNRNSPCVGTYTAGESKIAKTWLSFVNIGAPSKSASAQKLVLDAETKMQDFNQAYKFGDYTEVERDEYFNKLVKDLEKSFDNLNLDQWNNELQTEKNKFNERIVNGNKEDCFDLYFVSTSLSDYVDYQDLKTKGL